MAAPTDHVPIISYILVSEFDILKGSTLKASYPSSIPNYEDNFFSNLMLPEGAHHHEEDTTIFFLHRHGPRLATTTTKETAAASQPPRRTSTAASDPPESLPIAAPAAAPSAPPAPPSRTTPMRKVPPVRGALLKYDLTISDWIRLGGEREWLTFDMEERSTSSEQQQEQQQHDFVAIDKKNEERRRLKIHVDLEYTKLSDTFASVYDEEDQAVGLLFKSTSDLSRFETLLRSVGGCDEMVEEETKTQGQEQAAMTINVKAISAVEEAEEEEEEEEENNTSTGTSATTTTNITTTTNDGRHRHGWDLQAPQVFCRMHAVGPERVGGLADDVSNNTKAFSLIVCALVHGLLRTITIFSSSILLLLVILRITLDLVVVVFIVVIAVVVAAVLGGG